MSQSKRYLFIIETNLYAGNFEREICAYATGQYGECEVGSKEAQMFKKEEPKSVYTQFADSILSVADDDSGCHRPAGVDWNRNHNSVVIYFSKKLTEEMIAVMKRRAVTYRSRWYEDLEVMGFSMRVETTTINTEELDV